MDTEYKEGGGLPIRIPGRDIAHTMLESLRNRIDEAGSPHSTLSIITVAPTAATESYLAIKKRAAAAAGIVLDMHALPETTSTEAVVALVRSCATSAIVVQLPLPSTINEHEVLAAIPQEKDADVLSPATRASFTNNQQNALVPPVAAAIELILAHIQVPIVGASVAIVGAGKLVGEPTATLLTRLGAYITLLDEHTFGSGEALGTADIIVSGTGVPNLILPTMILSGVVLIDAGTSTLGASIVGDVDAACYEKAFAYTPVPGGVGPVAVACLMKNVHELAMRAHV